MNTNTEATLPKVGDQVRLRKMYSHHFGYNPQDFDKVLTVASVDSRGAITFDESFHGYKPGEMEFFCFGFEVINYGVGNA